MYLIRSASNLVSEFYLKRQARFGNLDIEYAAGQDLDREELSAFTSSPACAWPSCKSMRRVAAALSEGSLGSLALQSRCAERSDENQRQNICVHTVHI